MRAYPTSGDTTGVGTGLSVMGLVGSLLIGGGLYLAGRGLMNRSQVWRRFHIGFAFLILISSTVSLLDGNERIFAAVSLCLALLFLSAMFLPSVRKQFTETSIDGA